MRIPLSIIAALAVIGAAAAAQQPVPQPFPKPGGPPPPTAPAAPPKSPAPAAPTPRAPSAPKPAAEPTEATLGAPIYPGAQFIVSFDAGRGQRYYLFGTNAAFTEIVTYYRKILRQRGELVFEVPPTHMFDIGRFREETMAFPPSVTVKDYVWNGSEGYLNPRPENGPARFRTVIQIVPAPTGQGGR